MLAICMEQVTILGADGDKTVLVTGKAQGVTPAVAGDKTARETSREQEITLEVGIDKIAK